MTELRAALRRRRAELPAILTAELSSRIAHHTWRLPALARASRIACYMAFDGEVDCAPLMDEAFARGRHIFLPVLNGSTLSFARWEPRRPMVCNRFGIPEPAPDGRRTLRAADLDVVLAPLVAFDDHGRRLGMGGGYYDRSLRILTQRGRWQRPLFVGLAYEFQHVDTLPFRVWDVPLHGVVTERGARSF